VTDKASTPTICPARRPAAAQKSLLSGVGSSGLQEAIARGSAIYGPKETGFPAPLAIVSPGTDGTYLHMLNSATHVQIRVDCPPSGHLCPHQEYLVVVERSSPRRAHGLSANEFQAETEGWPKEATGTVARFRIAFHALEAALRPLVACTARHDLRDPLASVLS